MEEAQRLEGRQRARRMTGEVERRSLAFLSSLGFSNAEEMIADARSCLRDLQDWFAEQENNAQDATQPLYIDDDEGFPRLNPLRIWRDPFTDERKQELMEGVGCIAALIYQRDVQHCGIGWVFCEQPGRHYGKVVLGPGICGNFDGSLEVVYEDPWEVARLSWDEIVGDGSLYRFFGRMYPGGFGDGMNRAAQIIAERNEVWVPPMFYITGAEYPDEA